MAAAASPLKEKVQNLPLLCVETILKFTPSSKLARLCSIAVPMPGAFWNIGLETVMKKRLPLSLLDDIPCFPEAPSNPKALFDITGAKIATVKKPEMFRFCPIREFIESATLSVRIVHMEYTDPLHSFVEHGDALLSHMPNVVHLALNAHRIPEGDKDAKDLVEPCLKHLLAQLQSFEVSISPYCGLSAFDCDSRFPQEDSDAAFYKREVVGKAFAAFIGEARIDEMSRLRRLVLPEVAVDCLVRASPDPSAQLQAVLAGLSSLGIRHNSLCGPPFMGPAALNFVVLNCSQLSQLQLVVLGEFTAYLTAFRALQSLTSLGLYVWEVDLTGLAFDGSNAIGSVSDLRIAHYLPFSHPDLKFASFFPNAKTVSLKSWGNPDIFDMTKALFGERQFFPAVAKLSCFYSCHDDRDSSCELIITQFLANPRLPETVDLSPIIFTYLACKANLLTAIYCAMQASSIKSLLLRGPVNRDALSHLQSHIDLHGEMAKVSACKDRDLGDQPGLTHFPAEISMETDFQIIGLKTSGNLKGERFTIRVFHQLTKRVDIFG